MANISFIAPRISGYHLEKRQTTKYQTNGRGINTPNRCNNVQPKALHIFLRDKMGQILFFTTDMHFYQHLCVSIRQAIILINPISR